MKARKISFIFLEVEEEDGLKIPKIENENFKYLSGVSFGKLMSVEKGYRASINSI